MITRFGFAPRKAGTTRSEFQDHWRNVHGPIIRGMPHLLGYRQNHAPDSFTLDGVRHDACAETDFATEDAMERAFASQYYSEVVMPDEARFVQRGEGFAVLTFTPETRLPDSSTRRIFLLRRDRDEKALAELEQARLPVSIFRPTVRQISSKADGVLAIIVAGEDRQSALPPFAHAGLLADCIVVV